MIRIKLIFLLAGLLSVSFCSHGQQVVKGIVVDSASFASLPDVHVSIKDSQRGTFTDAEGNFMLVVTPNDTLEFTLIGYKPAQLAVRDLRYESIVRLAEVSTLLNPVIVNGSMDLQLPELEKKRIWQNNAYNPETVPQGTVPTFGPGVGIPLSIFSKGESEKRKAEKLREENEKVSIYTSVVTDPDVIQMLMKKYKLSEKGYYDLLTRFNEQNNAIMYSVTAGELKAMLDNFFSNHAPH